MGRIRRFSFSGHPQLSVITLLAVEGTKLRVEGLDAIDGTPVLDIKPYVSGFGPQGEVREPAWSREIMEEYWSRE